MAFVPTPSTTDDLSLPNKAPVSLEMSTGNLYFTKNLYNSIRNKSAGSNVFFSPMSLELALSLAYVGAGGNTAKELQNAMQLPETNDALFKSLQTVLEIFRSDKVTLNSANALFVQEDYPVKQDYLEIANKNFAADVRSVNFAKNPRVHEIINKFVDDNTAHKIPELFSEGTIDGLTRLIIVNAIYFKGTWAQQFDPSSTSKGDFFLNENDKVEVDFMSHTGYFKIAHDAKLKATILNLPYEGDEIHMVIIVPDEIGGLGSIEDSLPDLDLHQLATETRKREIRLKMPKFKLETTLDLVDILQEIGVKEMFEQGSADFSGISSNNDLYCSQVIQKTYLEVSEEGTEAAAATGVGFVPLCWPPRLPPEVKIDRPFLYYIQQVSSRETLFIGRLVHLI